MATSWKKDPITGQLIKVETPTTSPSITNPYTNQSTLYGQTSVAPKPTTPLSPTQPVATPAPSIQPPAPIGGGVGINPQTQQIQSQIDETKAKIKELQNVKSLMDSGYEVKAPGEKTTPSQEDILAQMEQRRNKVFQDYMSFLQNQPSPLDVYKQYRTELGLPEKEQAVAGIQGQVQKTEDLLNNLEKDIQARSGGFMVTAPMYRRQLATEGKPLREQYTQLLTGLGRAEQGLTGSRQQLAEMIGLQQTEQERQAKIAEAGYKFKTTPTTKEEIAAEVAKKKAIKDAGLTEAETQIIEKEGRQVLINKNTGETIKDLGAVMPKAPTEPEFKRQAVSDMSLQLGTIVGSDGYVSPENFRKARNAWVGQGFAATDFDRFFSNFVNPAHSKDYYLAKTSTESKLEALLNSVD